MKYLFKHKNSCYTLLMNTPPSVPPNVSPQTTPFSFSQKDMEVYYVLSNEVLLRMKRLNNGIANLYFTDHANNRICIPSGILVYTYDASKKIQILVPQLHEEYMLCWTDDYVVMNNNDILMNITNARMWEIKTFTS